MMKKDVFYVYVDWTCEEIPRPFYVGIGDTARVKNQKRNKYHTNISKLFGMTREIIAITSVRKIVSDYEAVQCWQRNVEYDSTKNTLVKSK